MEQRLNAVMPVTSPTHGHPAPNSAGIFAKMLPFVKYAVGALFISSTVLYVVHRNNLPAPVLEPADNAITIKDSTTLTKDSMADHVSIPVVSKPDTALAADKTTAADPEKTKSSLPDIPEEERSSVTTVSTKQRTAAANTSGISPMSGAAPNTTAPAANDPASAAPGHSASNVSAGNNSTSSYLPAAGGRSAKSSATYKTAAQHTPADPGDKAGRHSGTTVLHIRRHITPSGNNAGESERNDNDITATNTLSSSGLSQEVSGNTAASDLAAVNGSEASAMLKPALPARLNLQALPLYHHKTEHPLKASRETIDRLASNHLPQVKQHTPGFWQLLGQWTIPVPVNSHPGYYKGPDGNSQLYRLLIPGIRIQRTWNNAAISLDMNAMATQLYKDAPYYSGISLAGPNDKITRTLRQTFGYSASLAYHHRIVGDFFGSAGVQGYYGHTASIFETKEVRDTISTRTNNSTTADKSKTWNSIGQFQGNITAEVYYDHHRWQAAARTVIPVLHTAKDSLGMNMKLVMQWELLLRWKINRRK
ncbi:hypothetical protein DF182_10050 [Chitinophaga flava]|uniref:Uncharacterized protein n=2 Tax=Chitinophaga flava TaxID=2259036 RepID=A0A365Y4S6_9BACT|nr:hypothetical protein DF182_10050 [Chitinophaga flava]